MRGKDMAYIFQHYESSFTPFLKIGKQLVEVIRIHERIPVLKAKQRALEWLERVRLPAERVLNSYPFQLSGGQLQRASLAAALMMKPSLIIADEPTTALDALTGEQVLDLLVQLQKETGCAVLLISHDLTHVLKRADRIAVMYGGKVVETGPVERVRFAPRHPYTQLLLQARPVLSKNMPPQLPTIPGEPGAVARQGCPFALRCPERTEACNRTPPVRKVGGKKEISGLGDDAVGEISHTGKISHTGRSSTIGGTDTVEAHLVACHLMDTEEAQQDATASGSQTDQKVVYL
jgi:oligopeptide/dipeptide ABC transporter ATP-binding protein